MSQKYIEDLREIKDIMNRSSRFISLSGLAGVSAGLSALVGAYLAFRVVYQGQNYFEYRQAELTSATTINLLLIALCTLGMAIASGLFFTWRETIKQQPKMWDFQTKRLLINLSIPLITGGILCLILLGKGYIGVIAPLTLVFYGLALVNASKYTLSEIRSLGVLEILLGLIAMQFIGYGLIFWVIGFGFLHIGYGIFMHLRHKK